MAIQSWPSTVVMDLLQIESATFMPQRQREISRSGDGEVYLKELGPTLWMAKLESVPLDHNVAEQIMAVINSMEDQLAGFYVWNPRLLYPQSDPTGSIIAASSPKVNSINADTKRLSIKSLTNAYVLTRGDFFHVVSASTGKRQLFQIVDASVTANGSGVTAEFEVSPHIRAGLVMAVNDAITLIKPSCVMKIIPGSLDSPAEDADNSRVSFQTIEAPNA